MQVSSNSGQPLSYTAVATATAGGVNWLFVSPSAGTTAGSGTLTVTADGSKLSPGTYKGTVTVSVSNATNGSSAVSITLIVSGAGTLAASSNSLAFFQVQNGSAPAAKIINITGAPNSLSITATATTADGANWLTAVAVAPGTTPGQVQVSVAADSLAIGQYTGTVTVASSGATGSPISISVTLAVAAAQNLSVSPPDPLSFSYISGAAPPQSQQLQLTSTGNIAFTVATQTTDGGNWLSVSPASGVAGSSPTSLTVTVSPRYLAAGSYTGSIIISSLVAPSSLVLNVSLTVTLIPNPILIGIRNAASGATGTIAPGENIVIYGSGIGPSTLAGLQLTSTGRVSTNVGNTQVLFDGLTAAPIVYASATQTSVMVPYSIASQGNTNITVLYQGIVSAPLSYTIAPAVPGIYTQDLSGTGLGAILNQDNSVNGPTNPAAAGSVVQVFMTGEGNTTPQAITGGVAPGDGTGLNKPAMAVTATIGGVPATVQYAGSAPSLLWSFPG